MSNTEKIVSYQQLTDTAKTTAFSQWLELLDIIFEDEEEKPPQTKEYFESEHATECNYFLSGEFSLKN